jgi:hypothetical protein
MVLSYYAVGGSLKPGQSLRHDRATQCCAAFKQLRDAAGIKRLPLPPRSPWLQACAACWRPAVQTAGRARMILCGARALHHVLSASVAPPHAERPQQGTGTVVLVPSAQEEPDADAPVACRERLGGLLTYYTAPGRRNILTGQVWVTYSLQMHPGQLCRATHSGSSAGSHGRSRIGGVGAGVNNGC